MLINIVYYRFNDVNPSHIIVVDCCIHFLRGRGPVAAVRRRRPSSSIDATIRHVGKWPPLLQFRLLRQRRRHTSCPTDTPSGRTRRNDRFGAEAAEQDGFRCCSVGRCHLTGDHRPKRGTYPTYSYVENSRDTPQTPIDAS